MRTYWNWYLALTDDDGEEMPRADAFVDALSYKDAHYCLHQTPESAVEHAVTDTLRRDRSKIRIYSWVE